jgi:hypothetical protein
MNLGSRGVAIVVINKVLAKETHDNNGSLQQKIGRQL